MVLLARIKGIQFFSLTEAIKKATIKIVPFTMAGLTINKKLAVCKRLFENKYGFCWHLYI